MYKSRETCEEATPRPKARGPETSSEASFSYHGRPPPTDFWIPLLKDQLSSVVQSKPGDNDTGLHRGFPHLVPTCVRVLKYVDFSDKYGFAYCLSDSSYGMLFNDETHLLQSSDGKKLVYIAEHGGWTTFSPDVKQLHDQILKKKFILEKQVEYMKSDLEHFGLTSPSLSDENIFQTPFLRKWIRTKSSIIFHLSNGVLQLTFFEDRSKIIFCPQQGTVIYHRNNNARLYKLKDIKVCGCTKKLAWHLKHALCLLEQHGFFHAF